MSEQNKKKEFFLPHRVNQLIAAILGITITWFLNVQLGIDAVLASASVSLCGGILVRKYNAIIMAATFAGMSSISAIPTWYFAVLVGVIVFIVWILLEKVLAGVGGKYGFIGCISTFFGQLCIIPLTTMNWNNFIFNFSLWPSWFYGINGELLINIPLSILLSGFGAFLTIWLRNNVITPLLKEEDTVIASAIAGLLGFFIFWVILGTIDLSLTSEAGKLGAFVYMGSFVGMAAKKRVRWESKGDLIPYTIAGMFAGTIFLLSRVILCYGGLYGTTAFLSVLFYENIFSKYVLKQEKL